MKIERSFKRISVQEASSLLSRDDVLLLDSRDQNSFGLACIASARRLSRENMDSTILGTNKTRPVLIYCYHGNASQVHAQMFADFGFTEVYSLDGGFAAWQRTHARLTPPVLGPRLTAWLQDHGYPADDLDAGRENGITPLMRASKLGNASMVSELLQAGAALDAPNTDGNTALWMACVGESVETIDLLIRAGAAMDHQNDNGATCLMYAASTGKHAVVEMLLAAGADPRLKTLDDFTALDMAATIECLCLLRAGSAACKERAELPA